MTIYICETLYHVMIASLLAKSNQSIILCTSHEKKNMANFYGLDTGEIPNIYYFFRFRSSLLENVGIEIIRDRYFLRHLQKQHGFKDFDLVNFAWSINSIDRSSAYYYKKARSVVFYEEGANGAIGIPQSKMKLLIKKFLGIPVDFYDDLKLKSVFVQNPNFYDNRFMLKLQSFSLMDVYEKSEQKKNIVELFLSDEKVKALKSVGEKTIVFTQPLSEDGFITENEKIDIYRKLCRELARRDVFLKLHPRDTSDYTSCKAILIKGSFPSELLTILGMEFYMAIGICTSAVNNIDAKYRINLNNNFLRDKKFDISMLTEILEREGI